MTRALDLEPRITDPDGFYAALVAAHQGLTEAESAALNARLILLLANQVGDAVLLKAAIEVAADGVRSTASSRTPAPPPSS